MMMVDLYLLVMMMADIRLLNPVQVENGLVETVIVLISRMPRLRPTLLTDAPGQVFDFKPEFSKVSFSLLSCEHPCINTRFFSIAFFAYLWQDLLIY